jgi:hypothetical protein
MYSFQPPFGTAIYAAMLGDGENAALKTTKFYFYFLKGTMRIFWLIVNWF